jgi:hypothetical protein
MCIDVSVVLMGKKGEVGPQRPTLNDGVVYDKIIGAQRRHSTKGIVELLGLLRSAAKSSMQKRE